MFSQYVCEQLGWYVYALRDPRTHKVFYIGKGKDNRVFAHATAAADFITDLAPMAAEDDAREDAVSAKIGLIREILSEGHQVETVLIRHQISSGKQAYEIEAAVLDSLLLLDRGLDNGFFSLTNIAWGHHHEERGLVSTDVAISLYEAPEAPPVTEPVVMFRIPRLWTPHMSDAELYEATHGWWIMSPRRNRARYAFAVSRGVIRGVYEIESWRERVQGDRDWEHDVGRKPRWGFEGRPAPVMKDYLNKSVRHLYRQGEAGVFKYLNC